MKQRAVCFDLKYSWQMIARMYNNQAEKYNLGISEAFLLLNIPKEGVQLSQLAPSLGMEPSSLPRTLNNMENKGWIERIRYPKGDKRTVKIFLTETGLQARYIARDHVKAFNRQVLERVGQENVDIFFKVMDQINEIVKENSTPNFLPANLSL